MKWYSVCCMILTSVHFVPDPLGLCLPTKPTTVGMPRGMNKVQVKMGHRKHLFLTSFSLLLCTQAVVQQWV